MALCRAYHEERPSCIRIHRYAETHYAEIVSSQDTDHFECLKQPIKNTLRTDTVEMIGRGNINECDFAREFLTQAVQYLTYNQAVPQVDDTHMNKIETVLDTELPITALSKQVATKEKRITCDKQSRYEIEKRAILANTFYR